MNELPSSNGHNHGVQDHMPVNAYADALRRDRPPEIAEFELNTDPYANVVPGAPRVPTSMADGEGWSAERRRHPIVIAVSLLLIVVLVLPVAVLVFAHLGI